MGSGKVGFEILYEKGGKLSSVEEFGDEVGPGGVEVATLVGRFLFFALSFLMKAGFFRFITAFFFSPWSSSQLELSF